MRVILEEGDWQDVFHTVLPPLPQISVDAQDLAPAKVNMILAQYRAACQCDLAKWMAAREQEVFLRQRK